MSAIENRCPFCEIVAKRAPAFILGECASAVAFAPLNPVVSGHTLVVPRVHVEDAIEDPAVTADVFGAAADYVSRLRREGVHYDFNLIASTGAAATQTVKHLHVHIVPRRDGDGLLLPWSFV